MINEIEHRAGTRYGNADAITRRSCEDYSHCERVKQKKYVSIVCDNEVG